ncbi:ATP-dependent zinc metalloprotease FtsH [Calycomorphotria hydatis]|uniref:ATP-dependent zinc metalloprotease FtsH n=1 Tax=Calycomorphotria hydatis TaxID=2528027 RepID=A0A517TBL4_9PLAN|nr:ATP-dependent zinc metalloprotease FtsH [Calycomorphotria hydatis]QDT65763.1 ATP-dependent zinc metalloprotease FtsH 4 [Calycomorphotria hydatis]
MSESSPQPNPENNRPPKRRPDRNPAGNIIWYVVFALLAGVLLLSQFSGMGGKSLAVREFTKGIDEGTYNPESVSKLVLGRTSLSFTYQPPKEEGAEEEPKTVRYQVNLTGLGDEWRKSLTDQLDAKDISYDAEQDQSQWQAFAYLLVIPAMFLLFIVLMLRRFGGAGTAMNFGRSRGKLAAQEEVGITFSDVAGIDEAVNELKEIVEFLRTPQKYQALGGRIPRGVLLVGPPGTGKTLLAKAVAGEAGVPFFSLSGSDFVEMFVGVGAARVRDMFQQAVSKSPSIIFIDELDALGKTRGSGMPGGHDEREQTLNALLVEMDGFDSDHSVIVMGATNRPETLDPALLRPGRFDRNVTVDRPDRKGRLSILKVHAQRIKMDNEVDLERVARMTPGFVGADLANLVNEAALLAARADKTEVTQIEFEEGIERVVAGLEKTARLIHDDEREMTSYHECGHALVACSLPHADPVHKISIIPRGMGLGYTLHFPEHERMTATKTELTHRICCLLGGIAAEEIVFEETSTGAQNDLQRATDLARRMVTEFGMSEKLGRVHYSETRSSFLGPQGYGEALHSEQTAREIDIEIKKIIDEANATAIDILKSRRQVLDRLAKELLEVEVMDADHLDRILDEYKSDNGPQLKPGTSAKANTEQGDSSRASSEESTESGDEAEIG